MKNPKIDFFKKYFFLYLSREDYQKEHTKNFFICERKQRRRKKFCNIVFLLVTFLLLFIELTTKSTTASQLFSVCVQWWVFAFFSREIISFSLNWPVNSTGLYFPYPSGFITYWTTRRKSLPKFWASCWLRPTWFSKANLSWLNLWLVNPQRPSYYKAP